MGWLMACDSKSLAHQSKSSVLTGLLVGRGIAWERFADRIANYLSVDRCRDSDRVLELGVQCHRLVVFDWAGLQSNSVGPLLLVRLRRLVPDVTVMAAAKQLSQRDRIDVLEFGVDEYVKYDVDPQELAARLRGMERRLFNHRSGAALSADTRSIEEFTTFFRLSRREEEVISLLAKGTHTKEIAAQLGCDYSTVRTHLRRLCAKLRCSGSREALIKFFSFAASDPKWSSRLRS